MGDDESQKESEELKEKLLMREKVSGVLALALPVLHTQLTLNNLAATDLNNHLLFLESTKAFHERKRLYFYDKIFNNHAVGSVDWDAIEIESFFAEPVVPWVKLLLPLLLMILVLIILAGKNFKKRQVD